MKYTLENTAKATHYAYYANIQTEQFFDDSSIGNLRFMNNDSLPWLYCDYELSGINNVVIIGLSRPHTETKEHWTTNGVTKYAQPVKKIPVHWLKKKGIELAVGDGWSNGDKTGVIEDHNCDWFKAVHADKLWITSFADRPNTGKQPVGDFISIDAKFDSGSHAYDMQPDYFDWSLEADNPIKTWRPNSDALHEIYEKETSVKKPVHDPDQYLAGECVKESTGAVADDKPVFTWAVANAGDLPPVGCECEMYLNDNDGWVKVFIIGPNSSGILVVEQASGPVWVNFSCEYRPIDTRSGEEKAIDDIYISGLVGTNIKQGKDIIKAIKAGKIHGVKWVGE